MLSEEGRHYKISLQTLVWRNSEPKYVERLKRKGKGKRKGEKEGEEEESLQEVSWERSLCRDSSAGSPAKGGEGRQRLDGRHQLCAG